MSEAFAPTLAAAHERIAAVQPAAYARTRNAIEGAVSGLSPYITHGFVTLPQVHAAVAAGHALGAQHKFVFELAWREYFRHVWAHQGQGILQSLHVGPLPDEAYANEMPADIRQAATGVPVVDEAVRTLYATGMLHNHARMWLASYVVHLRKVHWRAGADWLYGHLLDGDLASNHLSWQWVAGTGSHKPYLFNADNVARYAPAAWHSPGTVIDTSYEALDHIARDAQAVARSGSAERHVAMAVEEPALLGEAPQGLSLRAPCPVDVAGRDVWLVHPWNLGAMPANLPADVLCVGVFVADFHRQWPWSARRWHFVGSRMAELAPICWRGDATSIGTALRGARRVHTVAEPHLGALLLPWAECRVAPTLFPPVDRRCDAFSQWWSRVSRGMPTSAP